MRSGSSGATTTPRPGRVEHQAVVLQQAQGLQHRLPRDRELLGDLLLRQPSARRERSLTYGVDQGTIDALDEVGSRLEANELGGHCGIVLLDSVYSVLTRVLTASPGFPLSNHQAMAEKLTKARMVEAMMMRVTRPLSAP